MTDYPVIKMPGLRPCQRSGTGWQEILAEDAAGPQPRAAQGIARPGTVTG
jgi:hypothetical protein